jgi:hypothetical protein
MKEDSEGSGLVQLVPPRAYFEGIVDAVMFHNNTVSDTRTIVAAVMHAVSGRANPTMIREIVKDRLDSLEG